MNVLIKVLLWIVFAWFGFEGSLGYLKAATALKDSSAAIGYLQISVLALGALGVMHTLDALLSQSAKGSQPAAQGVSQ